MLTKKTIILHPFCFAAFQVLSFYSTNASVAPLSFVVQPVVACLAATLILLAVLGYIVKDIEEAGLLTSICVLLFFTYGRVYYPVFCGVANFIENLTNHHAGINDSLTDFAFALWCVILFVLMTLVVRKRLNIPLRVLNVISFFCLVFTVAGIMQTQISRLRTTDSYVKSNQGVCANLKLHCDEQSPDIYYIIMDGGARSDVLDKVFHFHNDRFCEFLEHKGFKVMQTCHSNYQMTPLCLASTLNMTLLQSNQILTDRKDWNPLLELIQTNCLTRLLKDCGYKYIMTYSGWSGTSSSPLADRMLASTWDDIFVNWFADTTAWSYFESKLHLLQGVARRHWQDVFAEASTVPAYPERKLVFIHLLLPHPPYLFAADGGNPETGSLSMFMGDYAQRENYLGQYIFTETKVGELIDSILSNSKRKAVIVLQSDHGPASTDFHSSLTKPSVAYLTERMSIFNAYYFPDGDYSSIYPNITPANSFRVILNKYFQANLPLEPDRSYYSPYEGAYDLTEVTKEINEN